MLDRIDPALADCDFYHVMDLPGVGRVGGQWDLRETWRAYLGDIDYAGRRVLEIGPASGFLTAMMERAGADVTAIEVPDDPGWDFVPYPNAVIGPVRLHRRQHMRRIKNSFWLTHRAFGLRARQIQADAANLPADLGYFNVAVMAAVLLHTRQPLAIVEACALRANLVVITEFFHPTRSGPVIALHPTPENRALDTWWDFTPEFFCQLLGVMGFDCTVTHHCQQHTSGPFEFFTVVARRR